jgi:hypothetical protein
MSILTHKNKLGQVDFHLIIRHNVGFMKEKVLFSNLPLELLEQANPQIGKLIKSQNKRLAGMELELLENLSKSVQGHPSLSKYIYPKEVLFGKIFPARTLAELLKLWNDSELYPGAIISKDLNPVKQYFLDVMFKRFKEFCPDKFKAQMIPVTRGFFEKHLYTINAWNEYKKFNGCSNIEYYKTETVRGFVLFVITIDGRCVLEIVV